MESRAQLCTARIKDRLLAIDPGAHPFVGR